MQEFQGKTAVVTGAASGIGAALARRLAEEGMNLVLADVEEPALSEVGRSLEESGLEILARKTDVSRYEDVEALAEAAYDRFGAVHLLCNNAGVGMGGPLWECTLDDWRWVLGVNLWGVIHGIKAFVPRMVAQQDESHVLNTASVAGLISSPQLGIYSTSKFGVVALSEALFFDLRLAGHTKVGVSVLCPGFVRTRIAEASRNRPAELSETTAMDPTSTEVARRVLESGMDPSQVAEIVLEAIREGRFYILTHQWAEGLVKMRAESIASGRLNPSILAAMAPGATGTTWS